MRGSELADAPRSVGHSSISTIMVVAEIYQPVAAFKLRAGRLGPHERCLSGCGRIGARPPVSAFLTLLRSHQG